MNMNMTTMPDIYAMEIGAQNAVKVSLYCYTVTHCLTVTIT